MKIFLFFLLSFPLICNAELLAVAGGDKPLADALPQLKNTVSLKGARGEVLNFMLRFKGESCGKLQIKGASFPVTFFRMEKIRTTAPSFRGAYVGDHFDPLVRLSSESEVCNGAWIWGEVLIPKEASVGANGFEISLGKAEDTVKVDLTVWKMIVPETPAVPAYFPMTTYGLLLGHYGAYHDGEGVLAKLYREELQKHRIYTLGNYVRIPDRLPGADANDLAGVLDFENSPSRDQSLMEVSIRGRDKGAFYEIPIKNISEGDPLEFALYLKAAEKTVALQKIPNKPLVYAWDEPAKEYFPDLTRLLKTVRTNAPSLTTMVTTPYSPALKDLVDIFVPVMDQFDVPDWPQTDEYKKFKAANPKHQVWWYVSCMSHGCDALTDSGRPDMVLDRPAVSVRVIPWLTMKYGIDAFLYYEVAFAYQHYPKRDPWKDVWDFSGNGDGTLLYPERAGERGFTSHGPAPSIRLKLWREASFDAEYVKWMLALPKRPAWWDEEFSKLIKNPQVWSKDYNAFQSLRDKAGEYLSSLN